MFISNIREYECECKCLFLIFVHANANANREKTCKYSHLRMRIFGPSLLYTPGSHVRDFCRALSMRLQQLVNAYIA